MMENEMKDCDFGCDDHVNMVGHYKHPDGNSKNAKTMHLDHQRAAAHPAKHSDGKMPAQLNPDHGPHHHPPHKHMSRGGKAPTYTHK